MNSEYELPEEIRLAQYVGSAMLRGGTLKGYERILGVKKSDATPGMYKVKVAIVEENGALFANSEYDVTLEELDRRVEEFNKRLGI